MGNRPDIIRLIPAKATRILDVGCGAGLLGKALTSKLGSQVTIYGIDVNKKLATLAKRHMNDVKVADLNDLTLWNQYHHISFDVIIFADVLEHLLDPLKVIKEASKKLSQDGVIITCIPNIRHWSTFYHLYILGEWPYNKRGIFDRTHLRFFTKKNISHLLKNAGLQIEEEKRNVRIIEPWSWTNILGILLDFWPLRPIFTFQYLHRCKLSSKEHENKH